MTTFLHYIGARYKPERFIAEAEKYGVTRRVAWHRAKKFSFGDRVLLAQWSKGEPYLFAEFAINSIVVEGDAGAETIAHLMEEGLIQGDIIQGDFEVKRECGSYSIVCACRLDESVTIEELVELCQSTTDEPWFMVGGPLTKVFDDPVDLDERVGFFRGFKEVGSERDPETSTPSALQVVERYRQKK